ncbi:MAG: GNAT family N-acetyltransferase [Solirubrobacterales bacterium]|nr:GNAT family N-acetyltransferase [Solirubrobacterales bacterium]
MPAAGPTPVTISCLELADPAALRPPTRPPRRDFEVELAGEPAVNRWFYERVGRDFSWTDRLAWSEERWRTWARRVETWIATVEGERAGYFELEPRGGSVQIAYFGLLSTYQGLGIGGHLLTRALRRALELGRPVRVHTNTLDGPHALDNYRARGMRIVGRRTEARLIAQPG